MAPTARRPLGPNSSWKTGQRVPVTGTYVDQHGYSSFHEKGATFPPCIGEPEECAFRRLDVVAATSYRA